MSESDETVAVERTPSVASGEVSVRLKLFMALLVGIVTAAAGCLAGIYSLRQPDSWVFLPQRLTLWSQMGSLSKSFDEYKEKHGTYPLTMEEIYFSPSIN